jgi:hypothetical protein
MSFIHSKNTIESSISILYPLGSFGLFSYVNMRVAERMIALALTSQLAKHSL